VRLKATELVVVLPGVQVHEPLASPKLTHGLFQLVHFFFALSQRSLQRSHPPLDIRVVIDHP
jgi:hypothetical protein